MSRNLKTLTLNRSGEFSVLTTGNKHCGIFTDERLWIKYNLICECENVLDSRGFLFEQVNIDKMFQNLKRTTLSCERLTLSCCKKVKALIRKDNPKCKIRSIKLTLSPYPYQASMTYSAVPK